MAIKRNLSLTLGTPSSAWRRKTSGKEAELLVHCKLFHPLPTNTARYWSPKDKAKDDNQANVDPGFEYDLEAPGRKS